MLTNEQWGRIRAYTDEVCRGNSKDVVFAEGRITREPDGGIVIKLEPLQSALAPLPGAGGHEVLPTADDPKEIIRFHNEWPTSGPGWPE